MRWWLCGASLGVLGVLFSLPAAVTAVKQYLLTQSGKEHCIVSWKEMIILTVLPKAFAFLDGLHHVLGTACRGSLNSGQALPISSRCMLLIKTLFTHHANIY